MGKEETWSFGTAVAIIERSEDRVRVRLQGWLTTMAYEALHMRLAGEPTKRRELLLDHDVQVLMTSLSAAEAALRGSPVRASADVLTLVCVPSTRLAWAQQHCAAMAGLRYQAQALPRLQAGQARGPWAS